MNRLTRRSKLRDARLAQGLSLERAAVAAGISVCWLRQLERDPSLLSVRVASRLLPVLGIAPEVTP
ncbi:MAG: helix-turn-helix transcriptional regulator [Anaeromyxobacteraceae bacterium]